MNNIQVLNSAQVNFLNLVLKEDNYIGKATTSSGKIVKLYRFCNISLDDIDYSPYLTAEEFQQLKSFNISGVFTPYFRLLIDSLQALVITKNLTLNFKHQFYDAIPDIGWDTSHMSEQEVKEYLVYLNNSFQDFRCKLCGHLMTITGYDSYFEYYGCINKPTCNYTLRVN